jgi:glycolate oxidase FAD binding subunit
MTDTVVTADKEDIAAAISRARVGGNSLVIRAGGTKTHLLGRELTGDILDVAANRGIIDYQPDELVVTVRAGSTIAELDSILAAEGQMLSSEPPHFEGRGTLGGTLASNLSGPARPWGGSLRDAVLGLGLVNGKGEILNFGGRVMKNVAGYDVSRLQAGAMGTLGVITELSLKVMPLPEKTLTLVRTLEADAALRLMHQRAGQPAPLSGACWVDGRLYLRLSGAASAVRDTAAAWGGDLLEDGDSFWQQLREMSLPCFDGDTPLWRLSLESTAALDHSPVCIDWCGAQRWVKSGDGATLHRYAARNGGHAMLYSGGDRNGEVRAAPGPALLQLQQRLKRAFDPAGVLNPGRLYREL